MGRHKLLHRFRDHSVELYDLREDIGERNDLSEARPELANRMLRMLKRWQKEVGAKFQGDVRQSTTAPQGGASRGTARLQIVEPVDPSRASRLTALRTLVSFSVSGIPREVFRPGILAGEPVTDG